MNLVVMVCRGFVVALILQAVCKILGYPIWVLVAYCLIAGVVIGYEGANRD